MKLRVNLITKRHFWDAGTEVPDHLIPVWCIKEHRIGDVEAAEICRRREELRAEARERREKAEAKKVAKKAGGQSSRPEAGERWLTADAIAQRDPISGSTGIGQPE